MGAASATSYLANAASAANIPTQSGRASPNNSISVSNSNITAVVIGSAHVVPTAVSYHTMVPKPKKSVSHMRDLELSLKSSIHVSITLMAPMSTENMV